MARTIHKQYDDDVFEVAEIFIEKENLSKEDLVKLAAMLAVPLFKGNLLKFKKFLGEEANSHL